MSNEGYKEKLAKELWELKLGGHYNGMGMTEALELADFIFEREKSLLKPIADILDKLGDNYGEFDALDDIEKYFTKLYSFESVYGEKP